jgi:hypothetical protein
LRTPGAGDYISGQRRFTGTAEDDYILDKVEMQVTNYPDEGYLKNWTQVNLVKSSQNKGTWSYILDTTIFSVKYGDGDLNIRLRVSDTSGREPTVTDEIIFLIRNDMPKIKLTMPNIPDPSENASGEGVIKGGLTETALNYGYEDELPAPAMYKRTIDMGSFISGTITYDSPDIYTGKWETAGGIERYPPQIRVWPISNEPDRDKGEYSLGEWPPYDEVLWETLAYNTGNDLDDQLFPIGGVGSYGFAWEAPEPGRFYGLEIRAQGKDPRNDGSIAQFHYPRDFWPSVEAEGNNWDAPDITKGSDAKKMIENRYVLFYVKEQSTLPTAELYGLEDLLNENKDPAGNWDNVTNKYKTLNGSDGQPLVNPPKESHPYVNQLTVNKNGSFTLRIKAYHPEGISSAEVYWQGDDGTRGRFIWDPADKLDEDHNVSPKNTYNEWGYEDPHDSATRNFIFTYNHGGDNKIPSGPDYNSVVQGRSKIQRYDGSDWDEGKREGKWPLGIDSDHWNELTSLAEGTYEIEVYVRKSNFNGPVPEAYTPNANTIRLDWGAPSVEINTIDGAFSMDLNAVPPEATVNGVIRTRLRFSDSRIEDTGLRGATDPYFLNPAVNNYGYEQFYVLVGEDDKGAMDDLFTVNGKTIWPLRPGTVPDGVTMPGVTIYKDDPIFNSEFMIKTSKIYDALTTENDALPDGAYWLYVFARDNAFNVGRLTPLKITVDKETDKPTIEFLGEIRDSVTEPDVDKDVTVLPAADKHGFWYGGSTPRNSLSPSSTVRLSLYDDDSLDLGFGAGSADPAFQSKVKVTFTGSRDTDGHITPLSDEDPKYLMTLSDAAVKEIFAPQSGTNNTNRQAVRTRETAFGEISQVRLLRMLQDKARNSGDPYYYLFAPKGGPGAYSSLPDGIYRIEITIDDYAPAKLKLDSDPSRPHVAKADITFWIIVDTTTPVITVNAGAPSGWISPDNGLSSMGTVNGITVTGDGVIIPGTISDRNGPVTVDKFVITNDLGVTPSEWAGLVYANPAEIEIIRTSVAGDPSQYFATYRAPVHIDRNVSSKFIATLQVKDRHGKTSFIEQRYQIDVDPPTVNLRKKIDTFERRDNARNPGSESDDNFTRLANGVLSFNISASDNLKVKEVRWWLLPDTETLATTTDTDPKEIGKAAWNTNINTVAIDGQDEFSSYNQSYFTTNKARAGRYTSDFTRTIYIDTTSTAAPTPSDPDRVWAPLDDDAGYILYVMAQDDAGNYSAPDYALQSIYILQKEDAPYFARNSLQGVVGSNDMIARITINDDDGFSVPSSSGLIARPGTVRIWLKRDSSDPASGFDRYDLGDNASTDWTAPAIVNSGVNLLGSKNISLNIDLGTIPTFNTILTTIQGRIHYVIEATDSWSGKFADEAGTSVTADTAGDASSGADPGGHLKFQREYYSFVLDSKLPTITITEPATGQTFGKASGTPPVTTNPFEIKGAISDAYLKQDSDGDYILGIRLGSNTLYPTTLPNPNPGGLTLFKLGKTEGDLYIDAATATPPGIQLDTPATGDTTVNFTIPADKFLAAIGYTDDAKVPPGINHTLTFTVEDQSGKLGSFSLNFLKDDVPPALAFTDIPNNTTLKTPQALATDWWTTADYEAKRAVNLPTVWYNSGEVPSISGTFIDTFSNIEKTSFQLWIDGATTALPSFPVAQLAGDAKYVRWTIYLTNNGTTGGTILPDGVHSIKLTVKDTAGNVLDESTTMYGFRINSKQPESTLTKPTQTIYGDRTGLGAGATVFSLSGTGVSYNLDDVELTIKYTGPDTPTKTSQTWSVLKSLDSSNTASPKWTFTTEANNGVKETYNWTLAIPKSYIWTVTNTGTIPANTLLRTGTYEVMVTAVDRSGKTSDETTANTWSFVIDSTAPGFNFTNLKFATGDTTVNNTGTGATGRRPTHWVEKNAAGDYLYINDRNVLASDTPSIRGRISDTNNLDAVEVQLAQWNYTTGAWRIYQFGGTAPNLNSWQTVSVANSVNDEYWSKLVEPTTTPKSPEYVLDWAFVGVTPALLTEGYYSVRLRARDVSTVGGSPTGWTATTNNGNPATYAFAYFFIDRDNPSLTNHDTVTTFSSRAKTDNALVFNVNASDANLFENLVVHVERINTTAGTLPNGNANTTSSTPITIVYPNPATVPTAVNTGNWTTVSGTTGTATVRMRFLPSDVTNGLPDGAYRIVFTATDLAGKQTRDSRTITLDNRAPTGVIDEPRPIGNVTGYNANGTPQTGNPVIHRFASEMQIGGEPFTIAGTTDDLGDNGSASGPKGIWYRIGYGTQDIASLQNLLTGSETAAERSVKIAAWAVNSGSGLTGANAVTADTGEAFNTIFDNVSATNKNATGSLWFKYDKTGANVDDGNTYDVPAYFDNIETADIYKWSLRAKDQSEVTGSYSVATNYANGFAAGQTMRTRTYARVVDNNITIGAAYGTGANAQYLARVITETNLPPDMRRGGVYSLPLVIRVVDNAGNVFYELRDIWLYPNGDYPSSVIINPGDNTGYTGGSAGSPLGGQISIEGVATDNKSIRTVIYRVMTGNGNDTAGTAPDQTNANSFVIMPDTATKWDSNYPGHAAMSANGVWNGTGGATGNTRNQSNWYVATLESQTYAPGMPWSFMLNSGGEINTAIASSRGFYYGAGTDQPNNMIRVWVEVYVFDGEAPSAGSTYNKISLGAGTTAAPQPYHREFYMKTSAPTITVPKLTTLGATQTNGNNWVAGNFGNIPTTSPMQAASYIRNGRFAVRAQLNAGDGVGIGEVQVRLRGETTESGWTTVFEYWDHDNNPGTASVLRLNALAGLSLRPTDTYGATNFTAGSPSTTSVPTAYLNFSFDPAATAATNFRSIRGGDWARSGGTFTVDVRVRDNATPSAESTYTFEVGVDNFVPIADTAKNITPKKVAGTNVSFLGRVFDYENTPGIPRPDHKKISEVRVWFTNQANTQYINMTTGAAVTQNTIPRESITAQAKPAATINWSGDTITSISRGAAGTSTSYNVPNAANATAANYVKVLSESASGITWSPTNDWDIFWSFVQNTTIFPDGWMTMHYIVTDHANNRSYYTQEMVVMNKYPKITDITLYTNNTGEGAVFTTHEGNDALSEYVLPETPYASGYLNSGFISKNSVIGFGVDTTGGNAPLKYQVRYVERYLVPLTNLNLIAMAGGGSGTRTLHYFPNATTLNAQGNTVPAPPTNLSTLPTNSGFIDFYTIAPGNSGKSSINAAAWRILGVPTATVSDGSHFVFQGVYEDDPAKPNYNAENNVSTMSFDNVYVYAYRQVKEKTAVTRTGANANTIPLVVGETPLLNFNGSDDFAVNTTGKIPEALDDTNPSNALPGTSTANKNGTAYFLLKVWDTVDNTANAPEKDMLYDAVVIGMKVFLTDSTQPRARLYDLNPYTETAVIGNNLNETVRTRTINEAAAPTAIGTNIKRGGLYNVGTERAPIKSGYIDPRTTSAALNPYVNYPSDPTLKNPYLGSKQERPNGFVTGDSVDSADTRDKVSGTILLRGLAWDDQLIDEIRINIAGTAKLIAKLRYVYPNGNIWTDENDPTPAQIQTNNLTRKMMPETGVQAWVYEEISWQSGHTVEWAYLWNTETEPTGRTRGGPRPNIAVAVVVQDLLGRSGTNRLTSPVVNVNDTPTAATPNFRNTINVDIVPYITGLKRAEPAYSTTRSRQGWYSFFQGETGIRVLGYNLGSSTNATTGTIVRHSADGSDETNLATNRAYTAPAAGQPAYYVLPNDGHTFEIGTLASGRIDVYVGSVATATNRAWNHSSHHANKSWNREDSASVEGSDLWNNKPYAHIWRTAESTDAPRTLFAQSGSVETPGMSLQYVGTGAGTLHGAWANMGEDSAFYADSTMTARRLMVKSGDPHSDTDIDFWNGTGTIPATNRSINDYSSMVLTRQDDGRAALRLKASAALGGDHGGGGDYTTYIIGPRSDNPTSTIRWQNTRISKAAVTTADNPSNTGSARVEGNAGRVFVTAYDASYKKLFFTVRTNMTSSSNGNEDTSNAAPLYLDGATGGPDTDIAGTVTNSNVSGTIERSTNAGEYSAIDYDSNGRPVIAYYDQANDTLRLAYASSNNPTAGTNWTRRYVLPSTDALHRGSGTYVSMKIQRTQEGGSAAQGNADIIHLAFFNSVKNTLVYASGTRTGTFTAYTVDNVVKGGTYTDISLDSGNNPWIVYADSARIGANGGARIAYRDTTAYTRALTDPVNSGRSIAGWEALTMPASYVVNRDRLNIAAWPPQVPGGVTLGTRPTTSTWNAAVGYGSDMFRLGYFTKPAGTLMTTGNWQEQ